MSFHPGGFRQFLTDVMSSFAGVPEDENSPGSIYKRMQGAARQVGMSVEELLEHRKGIIELEAAQKRADLAAKQASTRGTRLDSSAKDAELFSRTQIAEGETATFTGTPDDLTRLKPGQQIAYDIGGLEAVAGLNRGVKTDESGVFRPDKFIYSEDKTREEIAGLDLTNERFNERQDDLDREENDQNNFETMYALRQESNKLAQTKEKRYALYSELRMDLVREQISEMKDKKGKKGQITPGQAVNLASSFLINNGEVEEGASTEEDMRKVALLAQKFRRAFQNPNLASSREMLDWGEEHIQQVLDESRRLTDQPVPDFEDAEVPEQEFGAGLKGEAKIQGEADDAEERYVLDDDVPSIPPWEDGVPDTRALDPENSFLDLIGANTEQRARQEQRKIDANAEDYQDKIRQYMHLGVPRDEWQEYLRTFEADILQQSGIQQ